MKQRPETSWEASGFNWQFGAFFILGMLVLLIIGDMLAERGGVIFLIIMAAMVISLTIMTATLFYYFYKGKENDFGKHMDEVWPMEKEKARPRLRCITCGGYSECANDPAQVHKCQDVIGVFTRWRPDGKMGKRTAEKHKKKCKCSEGCHEKGFGEHVDKVRGDP